MAATRGKRRGNRRPMRKREPAEVVWDPKTKLGKLVRSGQIKTMSGAIKTGLPIREPEIVDVLLPEIDDEVIDVNMVQRMTDSGRRVKFVISVAVGNNDGFVGFGQAKGKEVGSSIRKAIENAKLNIIEIRRGCGSWECGCKKPHTVPFAITGKSGSVKITLKPAPQGIGLATGNVAKKILTLAGVQDCWAFTEGKTKTTVNYAKAVFNALEKNTEMRVMKDEISKIGILSGAIGIAKDKTEDIKQAPVESQPEKKPETAKETKEEKTEKEEKKEEVKAEPETKEKSTEEAPSSESPDNQKNEEVKDETKNDEPKSEEKPDEVKAESETKEKSTEEASNAESPNNDKPKSEEKLDEANTEEIKEGEKQKEGE